MRIGALEDLAKQLRFAPVETLRRQLERAEELAGEIEAGRNYPEDWIVFRITGYRPEMGAPAMFVGEALLGDVSALVERMSAAAGVKEGELEQGKWLDVEALCGRWGVSRKTLERWRREGLIARRVTGANGKPRLVFAAVVVERFEKGRAGRIEDAGSYSRIDEKVKRRMLRRAAAYARLGCSLNQAARRIAERYGRAHETVRQLLKRSEGKGVEFGERGPPSERERELIARSHWLGIEPAEVAKRLKRSVASVRRVVDDERAERLRVWAEVNAEAAAEVTQRRGDTVAQQRSDAVTQPGRRTVKRADAGLRRDGQQVDALTAEPVMSGLGGPGSWDLLEFVEAAREGGVALGVVERARGEAYRFLVARARGRIAGLPRHGAGATELDEIETDLRWAARLKAELVRSQLPLLVRVFESALGRKMEEVRAGLLGPLVSSGIAAIGEAVDAFEPEHGGRLAAPAGMGLNRVAAKFVREHEGELGGGAGKARSTGKLGAGVVMEDWTRRVAAWQRFGGRVWLEPAEAVRRGLGGLGGRERVLLEMRYGWGPRPVTMAEAAKKLGMTVMRAVQVERTAVRRSRIHHGGTEGTEMKQ